MSLSTGVLILPDWDFAKTLIFEAGANAEWHFMCFQDKPLKILLNKAQIKP